MDLATAGAVFNRAAGSERCRRRVKRARRRTDRSRPRDVGCTQGPAVPARFYRSGTRPPTVTWSVVDSTRGLVVTLGGPGRTGSGFASAALVPLCVPEVWGGVGGQTTPHHDVGLLGLDRFPRPQHTLTPEPTAHRDPLRGFVVEVGDELNSYDVVVSEGPLGDEIECLCGQATASDLAIEPVERLGSTCWEFELDADLADTVV